MATPHAGDEQLEQTWRAERAYLVDLAFRMLGDLGAAEDTVQEAFARLVGTDLERIDDQRGWLIVVTTRLCLDRLRSAYARHERPHEAGAFAALPEPQRVGPVDPADRVTLDDQVRLALQVVLDRLSPAERVVFVLHEVFALPFDRIAESTGRTSAGCRQLAHRARLKVAAAPDVTATHAPDPAARAVTDTFIAACATGDLHALMSVLAPDVHGDVDLGPVTARRIAPIVGAERVARVLLRIWGTGATLVSHPLAGAPALLGFFDQRLSGVLLLTLGSGRITKIHAIGDPGKLADLAARLSPPA